MQQDLSAQALPSGLIDSYVYPGTNVLRNRPGIRNEETLRDFEHEQSESRIGELRERPINGRFDLVHLKAIHAYLFQDVYEWAGKLRTLNISKDGDMFASADFLERRDDSERFIPMALSHPICSMELADIPSIF